MGGSHARHAAPETRRMRRLALAVVVPLIALTAVALVVLWPTEPVGEAGGTAAEELDGQVLEVVREQCAEQLEDDVNGCGTASVELTGADDGTREVEVPLPNGSGAPEVATGDDVVVTVQETPDGEVYSIVDQQRETQLLVLALAFVLRSWPSAASAGSRR